MARQRKRVIERMISRQSKAKSHIALLRQDYGKATAKLRHSMSFNHTAPFLNARSRSALFSLPAKDT